MQWNTKLLHLFIAPGIHPRERQKLKLVAWSILMATLINGYLFFHILANGDQKLLVMNIALLFLMSFIPYGMMLMRFYSASKHFVALIYPLMLTVINVVYGDMHTELIYGALAILVIYMMDNRTQRVLLTSWVAICFALNLVLMKGHLPPVPLVDFGSYQLVVEWMVYLLGFATNVVLVTSIMIQNRNYQRQLSRKNVTLRQLNQDKDKFMSVISHDLRGPFTSILGLLEALRTGHEEYSKKEIQEMVVVLDEAANNTYKLLEDLLSWSKVRLGRIEFHPHTVDLYEEVKSVLDVLGPVAELKQVQIINRVERGIEVYADRTMLQTVFRNLLSNAIKFTEPDGKVTLEAELNGNQIVCSVSDTGIGMSEDQQKRLFEAARVNSTPGTASESGSGLGLLICKEFIDKHGGQVWFRSEPGKGTTFFFSLARSAQ